MADQKLSALAVAVLTDASEMYLNAGGSRKATLENLRNFFLGAAVREAVVAASTGNGALATDFENGDVLDGVTLVTGDRIILKDQTAGAENGPYTVEATGAPTRATDFDVSAEAIRGATFMVIGGTANANTTWMHTTVGAVTLGSTSLVFTQIKGADAFQTVAVQTTDATQTVLASGAMASSSSHTIKARGHGYEDATGDTYHFEILGGARNEGGTSTAPTPNVVEVADAGATTWDATFVANDTTDVWEIKVTGEAAHTIDWTVEYTEISTIGA